VTQDSSSRREGKGPFRADQLRPGDRYELHEGHAVYCAPTGARGSRRNLTGGSVLDSDPDVEQAGIDTGFSPREDVLRAPDIAVGNVPDAPGWVRGSPPLAVEYADVGQDEAELQIKIRDLLDAGTRLVWVVRLLGPRRVEVYEAGRPAQTATEKDELTAPGILRNSVPVRALYDREAAHEATLRNLLQRRGFASIEALRDAGKVDGRVEGHAEAVVAVLEARGLVADDAQRARLLGCRDLSKLDRWLVAAITASTVDDVIAS
jgi:Uma2 family endonuclease